MPAPVDMILIGGNGAAPNANSLGDTLRLAFGLDDRGSFARLIATIDAADQRPPSRAPSKADG